MKDAVRDSAGYCGPTVIAAITGKPTSTVEDIIRYQRDPNWKRKKAGRAGVPVRGTGTGELGRTFAKLGWRMERIDIDLNPPVDPTAPVKLNPVDAVARLGHELNAMFTPGYVERNGRFISRARIPKMSASTARRPTLAAWLRKRTPEQRKQTFVVEVAHHWIAVTGKKFVDTYTKGKWVWLKDAPHRRKRVRAAWKVERV